MNKWTYTALLAKQAPGHEVFVFSANPKHVLEFSEIERVSRDAEGELRGFQRHQIASHIKEIRDYLSRDDALLPNAIIVAFVDGVKVKRTGTSIVEVTIEAQSKKPGFIVDGQQRLTALSGLDKPEFEVFVSALVCKDYNELRQQFVLINNTRPLPKTLIYELLPTVDGLPERYTARKFAARVVTKLNFSSESVLRGEIYQHTNPTGKLSDTAMQRIILNSSSDGAIRQFIQFEDRESRSFHLVNNFFRAVAEVFSPEWHGMSSRESRLRHGAGLIAMGFVMDTLYSNLNTVETDVFIKALRMIKACTAWTSGTWNLTQSDRRPWNGIQNTPTDIDLLTRHLVRHTRKALGAFDKKEKNGS